jgi:hypothetical protein
LLKSAGDTKRDWHAWAWFAWVWEHFVGTLSCIELRRMSLISAVAFQPGAHSLHSDANDGQVKYYAARGFMPFA